MDMEQQPTAPANDPGPIRSDHADGWGSRSLWFAPSMADAASMADADRRPTLTRERVVAEALTVIADEGVEALTMRNLAARLGVVPGALYRHVRNKEQLQDLVLDGVLAEVDCDLDPTLAWTARVTLLAHRLRDVLEAHPGIGAIAREIGQESLPPLGAMIETPSAALTVADIARHSDFLCIGTNDLTQYTLAVGRDDATVSEYYIDDHPALL